MPINENVSGEVAPLLAYLRELQRRHAIAVILVHHARKGAGNMRAATLYERLAVMAATGRIVKSTDGYRLAR